MTELALTALALALVACSVWIARLHAERARLAAARDLAEQRLADLQRDEGRLREGVESIAARALEANSRQFIAQFLPLAREKLGAHETAAVAEMDKRKAALDQLLLPIGEALKKTQEELRKLEGERASAYAGLKSQVVEVQRTNEQLRAETSRLVQALSKPSIRGRYGEIQLQRVAELAGMRAYCDFALQESVRDAEGNLLKPDMVVKLPNGREIAVDAKTNIDAYLAALDAAAPDQADLHLQRFATHVVEQVHALAKKSYWKQYAGSPELVVMFVPGDQFVDAALTRRPDLIDVAAQSNVVIASPSTLIGLLRAISVGWREMKLGESARELFELGRELHGRVATALGHADKVGNSLRRAVDDYNKFIGSVEMRVLPTLRKFEESGASSGDPIDELSQVESLPRTPPLLDAPPSDPAVRER